MNPKTNGARVGSTRVMRTFVVFAFRDTQTSLDAEITLRDAGLAVKVMPLPRHRGSLCGIALRLPPEEEAAAVAALYVAGIRVAAREEIEDV